MFRIEEIENKNKEIEFINYEINELSILDQ